ncbi:MAG: OmpA family protein [Bacteroidales bacterium]
MPNHGTPDVFTPENHTFFNNNQNKFGIQRPQEGQAYSNIIFESGLGYEYVSVVLTNSLETDSDYCISFYLSLMDKSRFIMNGIGIDLSTVKPNVNRKEHDWNGDIALYKYEYYKGQNVVLLDTLINDKENWVYCSLIYRAKGGEKYLTIGNFVPYEHASFYNVQYLRKMKSVTFGYCGYYIDNVSMVEISDSNQCPCYKVAKHNEIAQLNRLDSVKHGIAIVLSNVLFETSSSTLLLESFPSLNEVVAYMNENPDVSIEIRGHTDNQGDSTMNLDLSRSRATSVAYYIRDKGIDDTRLSAVGFGDTQPIADNNTEEGRQKNRRVEIVIIRK